MRLVGLDISGWLDVSARDWDADNTHEAEEGEPTVRIIDGGAWSVAIKDNSGHWIGGPQAILAPHGLGPGWGEIGSLERRLNIVDCLDCIVSGRPGQPGTREALAASVDSLGRNAECHVLNVPDLPEIDEGARGRLLNVFPRRMRAPRLLWRPVALFLEALRVGRISRSDIGCSFGFLIHSGKGFEFQTLRLREDREHPGHLAPERDGYGVLLGAEMGLQQLAEHVKAAIDHSNPILADKTFGRIEIAPRILTGHIDCGTKHVVRQNNGVWIELITPPSLTFPKSETWLDQVCARLDKHQALRTLFVCTPLRSSLANDMLAKLRQRVSNIEQLSWQDLASGALRAGRIVERGLPHYFDRLTPISLAVFQANEPIFSDLIGEKDTLPANKEFVSEPYRDLEWPASKKEIEFFVLKGETEVRHWVASMAEAPDRITSVELVLRQTPGQSWAKLQLTSPTWELLQRNPLFLNWDNLQPLQETPEEILQRLRRPPPTIPTRISERAHQDFWFGNKNFTGILEFLAAGEISAPQMAKLLNRRMKVDFFFGSAERVWPIGTDGELPADLSDDHLTAFAKNIASIAGQIAKALNKGRALPNNDELRCLTWMFTRCPDEIQTAIVEALEADLAGRRHPLLEPLRAKTVLVQGAGRAITGVKRIRRVLRVLTTVPPYKDTKAPNSNTFAALAMILARRKEAPFALDEELVTRIARIVSLELANVAGTNNPKLFKTRFKNALSALAGLFRYREVQPFALLRHENREANKLASDLESINKALKRAGAKVPQAEDKIALVGELLKLLEGKGDPNILRRIETSEDDDEDE
jgi:hypothetical protein